MYKTAGRQKGKPPPPPSALRPTDRLRTFGREITRRIQILPRSENEKRRKREIVSLKRLCDHAESLSPLLGRVGKGKPQLIPVRIKTVDQNSVRVNEETHLVRDLRL